MEWAEAGALLASPILAPLAGSIARLPRDRWPGPADLDALASDVRTASGLPLRFAPPDPAEREPYELAIARTGVVPTRPRNWHDLFNALAWITYPRAKSAINAAHAAILRAGGAAESRHRSPARDALTLFDEGGLAVVSSRPDLLQLIVDFRWKELFWTRREALAGHVRFLAFGHSLHEKALQPYLGMVAKTIFIEASPEELGRPLAGLVALADERLARHFGDPRHFASPRLMAPLPVLGIPGWHADTGTEAFYNDRSHFRDKTRK